MGRAANHERAAATLLESDARFQAVLGGRRGSARPHDALLAARPRARAQAETDALVARVTAGEFEDAFLVLGKARRNYNRYVAQLADTLASAYADRAPSRWQLSASAANNVFQVETVDAEGNRTLAGSSPGT